MKHNIVIVGAGLFGCTCARILAENGFNVILYEKRNVIGGNAATHFEEGIEVHDYGCHIFHTDNDDVWNFISRFTQFNQYQHHAVAKHNEQKYFMPFNLMMIEQFFKEISGPDHAKKFMSELINNDMKNLGINSANIKNLEEQAISSIGVLLYEAFVKNYTKKQWNCDPKKLDASIIKRIPIRYNYNISYFNDRYQGIPINGYDKLFNNMLQYDRISVHITQKYCIEQLANDIKNGMTVIYTGSLDELFNYKFGILPWRSLRFETECIPINDFQGNSTINYVDANVSFTRIHEFKHFHPEDSQMMNYEHTVIQREFPEDWTIGKERFYPINNKINNKLHAKYIDFAKSMYGNKLLFGGRLGMYRYFDMDDTIEAAIALSNHIIKKSKFCMT